MQYAIQLCSEFKILKFIPNIKCDMLAFSAGEMHEAEVISDSNRRLVATVSCSSLSPIFLKVFHFMSVGLDLGR